jgi:hypothetical protein
VAPHWQCGTLARAHVAAAPLMFKPSIDVEGINLKIIDYKIFFVPTVT